MSFRSVSCLLCLGVLAALPTGAVAGEPDDLIQNPWMDMPSGPLVLDASYEAREQTIASHVQDMEYPEAPSFDELDDFAFEADEQAIEDLANPDGQMPQGWVQRGSVALPEPVAQGLKDVDPEPLPAWEDIPGNKYPRKHTVYLNFQGGMLYSGKDNSAESKSTLAKQGVYPTYGGGNSSAIAAAQAFAIDVEKYGIRVMYETRPSKMVPYTMVMVGGNWTDTNLEDPAGGVAPGADCEARGQRHVVYTFLNSGSISVANVSSQEAGHSWGLDHTNNCGSVMAYCGGGDKFFSNQCDSLCEASCQGPNSAGCRLTHEKYCGVDSDRQNEDDELTFIFGGNEPDNEPPEVAVLEPADGSTFPNGSTVAIRASVSDNYGGVGWKNYLDHDGEVILDAVDYYKDNVDDNFNAAINATNLPPGTYTYRITAEDHADHVVMDEVTFTVDDGPVEPTTTTGDSSTDSGGSDSGTTGASGSGGSDSTTDGTTDGSSAGTDGSSGGTLTTTGGLTGGEGTKDDGCACSMDAGAPGWLGLAFLPLLGLAPSRRRRR